jgi:ribose transport system ATP-binding protein
MDRSDVAAAEGSGDAPLLEARGVGKRFAATVALAGVSLSLRRGEVLAVIGENGAGKSTLMKILAGVQLPDEGSVLVEGKQVWMGSVQVAMRHGVVLIHQELNLADQLSVGANLYLGREPTRFGLIDERAVEEGSRGLLARVGLDVSPGELVGRLAIGKQQMVEIAKALAVDARVLIMDEPTSSLTQGESEALFRLIRELRAEGVGVIYISHRLGEVDQLADRVVVLRDGCKVGELGRHEIDHDRMVSMMVGRELSQFYPHQPHEVGEVALEVKGLRTVAHPGKPVSLVVREGEIVGVAGLVGAGRSELVEAIFGVRAAVGGEVRVGGEEVRLNSPRDGVRAGLALVPEDRKRQGLVLEMDVKDNLSLASLGKMARWGVVLDGAGELRLCEEMMGKLRIKAAGGGQIVRYLSGGNQQKVVLGKWLALGPRVLLLDEPTRGIDIGAKREIYGLMEELARQGVAILFVSSEMEEVLGMADRVLVMHEGRISGELQREELGEEAVIRLATGMGVEGAD